MNAVLIGFMGTGKSAIGRALALQLDACFLDTDAEIEKEAGRPIRTIFSEDGEARFRALETHLLERLADSHARPPAARSGVVLATGGGTPLRADNVALLRRIGAVIWLTAPAKTILRRVGPDLSSRPLLADFQSDPLARIGSLLAAREPHYQAAADVIWDTTRHLTPAEAAAVLAAELCQPAV